jgi:hypothetical protein
VHLLLPVRSLMPLLCYHAQAEKKARQKAKEKEKQGGKAPGAAGSSSQAAAAAADGFDEELAAAMAEAAAISSRCAATLLYTHQRMSCCFGISAEADRHIAASVATATAVLYRHTRTSARAAGVSLGK